MPVNQIVTFDPSSLETIDKAVYEFVDDTLNVHTLTNNGFTKVPVLWLGTERAYQIKNDKNLRDEVGKLILPLITVSRISVVRDEWKGSYQAYYPQEKGYAGGAVEITKIVNQEKTRNFANAKKLRTSKKSRQSTGRIISGSSVAINRQIVYDTITIPKPTYVTCMFEVNIRTEYQQQMNDLIPPFIVDQKNVYPITQDGHKYELFIQDDYGLSNNAANFQFDERMFVAKVNFKVLGYLVGDGTNRNRPQIVRKQNAVSIKISEEYSLNDKTGKGKEWAGVPFDDEEENYGLVEKFTGVSEEWILDEEGNRVRRRSITTTGSFRQF